LSRRYHDADTELVETAKKRRLNEAQVAALLEEARDGSQEAWDELVDFFGGLIWAIARSHNLGAGDAADVAQVTWLRLVEHLDRLTEPERLAAWLATTTRRECLRVLRAGHAHVLVPDDDDVFDPADREAKPVDAGLLAQEQRRTLAAAFRRIPNRCQVLLRLLTADPPLKYQEVSEVLGMPIGSIGPTRQRCLECLRQRLDEVEGSVVETTGRRHRR
jgi:RNA polymerase sigma factor (sigma-70 family)